jgi:hypothetical protein
MNWVTKRLGCAPEIGEVSGLRQAPQEWVEKSGIFGRIFGENAPSKPAETLFSSAPA